MKKRGIGLLVALMVAFLFLGFAAGRYFGNNRAVFSTFRNIISGVQESKSETSTESEETPQNDVPEVELLPQPEPRNQDGLYTTEIFEKVNPSTVCINVYSGRYIQPVATGTGIIMTSDGYIITNAHVVSGASSLNIVLSDETSLKGRIVGYDTDTDLAVVKVDATNLPRAEFGDSTTLKVGEKVVAIGNAGGLSGSCTEGIVSGLNRDVDENSRSLKLIQTSAAINPGNSGGPLVNRFGQVIGITSSKIASVDYEGIGFAIPITDAMTIINSLIENGYVTGRAVLGVSVVELNSSNGPRNGLPSQGSYIAEIQVESDLGNKGVREGDVIIEANGVEITSNDALIEQLTHFSPGDIMNIVVYRPETDETFSVDVVLIESKN